MPVILLETPAVFFKNPALDIVIASTGILSEISVLPSNGFLVLNRCAIAKQLGGLVSERCIGSPQGAPKLGKTFLERGKGPYELLGANCPVAFIGPFLVGQKYEGVGRSPIIG